jgi:hypothetical protein
MAIRDQNELRNFLEPFELDRTEMEAVIDSAIFRQGRCFGMYYGPLRTTLSFAQFDKLLKELNVSMQIGSRWEPDVICPDAYPASDRCVYRANYFCNITAFGGTAKDCPQPP